MSDVPSQKYDYPVYGTQGGGLVRRVGNQCIFVEKPDCPGLDVGDTMPTDWDIIPANQLARNVIDNDLTDQYVERVATFGWDGIG
jgi:hypothetical protein